MRLQNKLFILSLIALSACGGGGNSTPTTPTSTITTFPVASVFSSLATQAHSFSLNATYLGSSLNLAVTFAPGQSQTNNNISSFPLNTFTKTILEKSGNTVLTSQIQEFFVSPSQFLVYGYVSSTEGIYSLNQTVTGVQTSQALPPVSGVVGQVGPLYTLDSTNQVTIPVSQGTSAVLGSTGQSLITQFATWSLSQNTPNTAWLCINIQVIPHSYPNIIATESDCLNIDANGNILNARVTDTAFGVTLTFQ